MPAGHVAPTVHEQLVPLQQFGPHPYGPLLSPCCRTTNGEHPVGEHDPQPQLPAQGWTPEQLVTPELQLWVVPGEHEPWPPHAPKPDQVHAELQDSDCDPQLPQACDCVAPAAHAAKRIAGLMEPSLPQGVVTTISLQPATLASVMVINAVETSGAVPPGTYTPTR